jgi:hypothetical protein
MAISVSTAYCVEKPVSITNFMAALSLGASKISIPSYRPNVKNTSVILMFSLSSRLFKYLTAFIPFPLGESRVMNNIQIHLMNIYRIRLKTCAYIKEEVELCNLRQRMGDPRQYGKP